MGSAIPARAHVVVIGGGIIGTSTAYHLANEGWSDVVVVEQGHLSGGTTWHAAGLVGQLRPDEGVTRLIKYSTDLYERLESETGYATGWHRCGSLQVAQTPERMTHLRRSLALARAYGVQAEEISPQEAAGLYPLMSIEDLVGALWIPGDGKANPSDITQSLARGAQARGVRICEGTRVTAIQLSRGRVTGVSTPQGDIECEVVVNCGGQWAPQVGALVGATIPLHSAEHYYVVTEALEGMPGNAPVLRDPDGYTYYKEEVGGLAVGGFEPHAKPWVSPSEVPTPFEFQLLDEDWNQFSILMENAIHRVPALADVGIRKFYNGPESFTPDNNFLLGYSAEADGFFVAAGLNSIGIGAGGGVGRAAAEWIMSGEAPFDLATVDVRRFTYAHGNEKWLASRVRESLGLTYAVPWPNRELSSGRGLRKSPVYHQLERAGAVFGERAGWERPLFYSTDARPTLGYTFGEPVWADDVAKECQATREDVALFDLTSFAKFIVKGNGSEAALQYLCSADVAVQNGRTVYTAWLNDKGTYLSDLTVTRISHDEYLVVTSAAQQTRDFDYLSRGLREWRDVEVVDVTSSQAVFGVMGPSSRALLASLSKSNLEDASFPQGASKLIDLGESTVRASRLSYVGELGWELYVPAEMASSVYEQLSSAGSELGLRNAGYYALDSLRLEKGYRSWGHELTSDFTPVEAGLTFTCKMRSGVPFRGREAVAEQLLSGTNRRLCLFVLDDPDAVLWGHELILRNGQPVGHTTSGAYGHTLGASVGLGYVGSDSGPLLDKTWLGDAKYEVNVAGTNVPATLHLRAPI